jgi:biopolymer transport protein ExbD
MWNPAADQRSSGDGPGEDEEVPILSEINITPLTDVFLVLLIIFMVVASSVVDMERQAAQTKGRLPERALEVQTPEGSGDSALIPKDVIVSVLPDGTLYVDADVVALDDLDAKFREIRSRGLSSRVVVRGDETVAYRTIMAVITKARLAGLRDVALSTRPRP